MSDYIHGSTDDREVARLEKQAHLAWSFVGPHFNAQPGERILDLATGVGAMAGRILEQVPRVRLFGVDLRLSQLGSSKRNHPQATYVNADGGRLPFQDGAFDRIHCSWLLEHVPDPLPILRECHRVLREGGVCHFIEVDNSTFRVVPHDADIQWAMDSLNRAQQQGGGDPFVGKKLQALYKDAGFRDVQLHDATLDGTPADLKRFHEAVVEFAEIFESLDEALGPANHARLFDAARKLRELPAKPQAAMHYSAVIAIGRR